MSDTIRASCEPILRSLEKMGWWAWLALLVCVPVTSSPIVAVLSGGETPVSPLSLIPLAIVFLVVLAPFLSRGSELPALIWPLLLFAVLALISAACSYFLPLLPFKGQTSGDRIIRALITIGVGLSFYLAAVILMGDKKRLKASIKAIYLGLIGLLIWSSVQAWLVLDGSERVPLIITRIHHLFSVRDPWGDRVTGMAFEPSWLGDQLVVLYIPLLLASVILRRSVFKTRFKWFSLEWLLLIWSFFVLMLTQSRISFLSLFAGLAAIIVYTGVRWFWGLIGERTSENRRLLIQISALALSVVILSSLLLLSGWVLSRVDERMALLFTIPSRLNEFAFFYPGEAHFELANSLAFAERVVYWATGWRTFSAYPILGVGPGNMGFFFEQFLPHYGYQLTEMQNVLQLAEFGFPNPKNLWIRLLAEGGILGFSSYVVWCVLLAVGAFSLWREGSGILQLVGLASTIAVVTMTIEGFSIDTYALPHNWIIFGALTASLSISGMFIHPGGSTSGSAKYISSDVS